MASAFIYISLVLFASQVYGETYNQLTDCDKTVSCVKTACTELKTCNGLAMYYYNNTDNMFYVHLVTSKAWMGFAQKTDGVKMTGLKGVFCANTATKGVVAGFFSSNKATGQPLYVTADKVMNVKIISTMKEGDVTKCSYKRPMKMTEADSMAVQHDWEGKTIRNVIAFGDAGVEANGNVTAKHTVTPVTTAEVMDWMQFSAPKPSNAVSTKGSAIVLLAFVLIFAVMKDQ